MTADNRERDRAAVEATSCLSLIDGPAIDNFLDEQGNFDKDALMMSLTANEALPSFDPAGYLIARRSGATGAEVSSLVQPYDFGVAGASALLKETIRLRGLQDEVLIPGIPADFDRAKTGLIEEYLEKFREVPIGRLIRHEPLDLPPGLVGAINVFADRCRLVVLVGFSGDGYKDDVLRGAYDYFRVISILENPEAETARRGLSHMMMSRLRKLSRQRETAA